MALSDTGLVVRYYFDEGSGSTAGDVSGNAYDLTIDTGSGNLAWAGSAGAKGLECTATTGVQKAYHTITASDALISALNGVTQATVEIVCRIDAISASGGRVFVVNDTAGGNARIGLVGIGTTFMRAMWNGKTSEDFGSVTSRVVIHLVYDTTQGTEDPRVKLYRDGSYVADIGSTSGITASEALSLSTGQQLIAFNRESSGSYDRSFDGLLAYAAIYTGAFDSTRVSDHYDVLTADDDEPAGGPVSHALAGAATASATASAALTVTPDVWVDTATEHVRTGTTSPQTFSHAGAASGVKGVVVAIVHGTSSTDHVSACSYGGVALTRIVRHTDTTTEPGAAELWFLGESVPQGTQTVSYTPGATTDDIHAVAITLIATADLEVIDSDGISSGGTTANPSVTLNYGGRKSLAIAALYGGGAAPSSFTPNGNCETVHDHDLGAFYSEVIRQTTPGTADFAIGGTSAADDVAFAALAVSPKLGVALAGAAAASGAASGAIDVTKPLAGDAVAGATASGALLGVAELAGEAAASATADAALTVTGALPRYGRILQGRRNRPGRGPYSFGRYYRAPRLGTYIQPAGTAQALAGDAISSAQASAALAVAKALAGAAAASGTASADLSLTKVLAGAATASALADAGISVGKPLAGAAVASGLASGELLGGINLQGDALAAAQAAGALTLAVPLAGDATASGAASGDLTKVVTLSGAAIGSGSADAAISVGVNLAGAAIAGASADGELLLGVTLEGDALAGALASAGLTILGSVDLEGAATGTATASGSLSLTVLLTGAATAGATASAGLAGSASLAGDAQATGTASAELTLAIPLSGAAISSALASGSLTIVATLAGDALAGASASADLLKAVSLQGDALATGQASARLGLREPMRARTVRMTSSARASYVMSGRRAVTLSRSPRVAFGN